MVERTWIKKKSMEQKKKMIYDKEYMKWYILHASYRWMALVKR